jgi:septum formation protein
MTDRLRLSLRNDLPHLRRLAKKPGLILASGSPRRKMILEKVGIPFTIIVPEIDETFAPDVPPDRLAIELAREKVHSLVGAEPRLYLGCDTIVTLDGTLLAKPENENHALKMLSFLSGKTHSVFTGLALVDKSSGEEFTGVEETLVTFNRVEENQLRDYIASGEPMDKAGAYGIQGMGRFLVDSFEGNLDNVIGLPLNTLERLAAEFMASYGG